MYNNKPMHDTSLADNAPRQTSMTQRMRLSISGFRRMLMFIGRRINNMSYLPKWLILATMIGLVAGFGAVLFYETLHLATHFFLGVLAGYHVPTPAGEGNKAGSASYSRPWAIPLVMTLGGLLSGWLVFTFAPEAEGHGTDAAINAVHHQPRSIRIRAVVVKIIASALTIGSGGSGGREGPTAQISAGFGSLLARVFDLSLEDGKIAVAVGIGSGIGAIFSAPLGGAVLAADIVYRDDFEFSALLPGIFASIISYSVFGSFFSFRSLFHIAGGYTFHQPIQLAYFAILGILAGAVGLLYAGTFYSTVGFFHKIKISNKIKPAIGALATGLIALALPETLGTGYGWIQKGLGSQLDKTSIIIIILLPFVRIIATSLSIGSGGSGGVFGPGMVIGAFLGLAVWRILLPIAPGVGHTPAPFIVVGMMAVFGSISRAPLAVMIMVAEMIGVNNLLSPAMIAVAIATFIVFRADKSIYKSQLHNRNSQIVNNLINKGDIASLEKIEQAMRDPVLVLTKDESIKSAYEMLQEKNLPGAPVVDERGTFLGTVDTMDILSFAGDMEKSAVVQLLDATAPSCQMTASLQEGFEGIYQAGGRFLTVTDGNRLVVGIITVGGLLRAYRASLAGSITKLSKLMPHSQVVEYEIADTSPLVGRKVNQIRFPMGIIIFSLKRNNELILISNETVFTRGDRVNILCRPENMEEIKKLAEGTSSPVMGSNV